jgi:clan AA aspartic protease
MVMGEVRVRVTLTNVTDLGMLRRNLLKPADVRKLEVDAMVDTGAVASVVPPAVADRLGLARPFKHMVEYADGRHEEVGVTEPLLFEFAGRQTHDDALVLGDEVIIGQTVLEKTDMYVDCTGRRLVPNPAHPDQPIVKIK